LDYRIGSKKCMHVILRLKISYRIVIVMVDCTLRTFLLEYNLIQKFMKLKCLDITIQMFPLFLQFFN